MWRRGRLCGLIGFGKMVPTRMSLRRTPTSKALARAASTHPGAQHADFELADAAVHAQQQPIIGSARMVRAVEVGDASLYQSAQLKQMMRNSRPLRASREASKHRTVPTFLLRKATPPGARRLVWRNCMHENPVNADYFGRLPDAHRRIIVAPIG